MSYTNTTTHYNWPLPEETDLFNGLDDNQMKEDLDEKIYNLEQQSSGDHEAVTQLNARVTEVEQTVGGYDEEIEALQGTVAEHAERLVNLTNRQTELSRRLNGKAGESTIAPEYNPEESYNVGAFVYHNNILYKATAASATPAGDWDANDWDIAILTSELGGSTPGTIAAADVSFDDRVAQLGADDAQDAIDALAAKLAKVKSSAKTLIETITTFGTSATYNIDISDYNEVEFEILGSYSTATNKYHVIKRFKVEDIMEIVSDTTNKNTDMDAPIISIVCAVSNTDHASLYVGFVDATTWKFQKFAATYNINSVKVYGCK